MRRFPDPDGSSQESSAGASVGDSVRVSLLDPFRRRPAAAVGFSGRVLVVVVVVVVGNYSESDEHHCHCCWASSLLVTA